MAKEIKATTAPKKKTSPPVVPTAPVVPIASITFSSIVEVVTHVRNSQQYKQWLSLPNGKGLCDVLLNIAECSFMLSNLFPSALPQNYPYCSFTQFQNGYRELPQKGEIVIFNGALEFVKTDFSKHEVLEKTSSFLRSSPLKGLAVQANRQAIATLQLQLDDLKRQYDSVMEYCRFLKKLQAKLKMAIKQSEKAIVKKYDELPDEIEKTLLTYNNRVQRDFVSLKTTIGYLHKGFSNVPLEFLANETQPVTLERALELFNSGQFELCLVNSQRFYVGVNKGGMILGGFIHGVGFGNVEMVAIGTATTKSVKSINGQDVLIEKETLYLGVIDGQQRLTGSLLFVNGELTVKKVQSKIAPLDTWLKSNTLAFNSLSEKMQSHFLNAPVNMVLSVFNGNVNAIETLLTIIFTILNNYTRKVEMLQTSNFSEHGSLLLSKITKGISDIPLSNVTSDMLYHVLLLAKSAKDVSLLDYSIKKAEHIRTNVLEDNSSSSLDDSFLADIRSSMNFSLDIADSIIGAIRQLHDSGMTGELLRHLAASNARFVMNALVANLAFVSIAFSDVFHCLTK